MAGPSTSLIMRDDSEDVRIRIEEEEPVKFMQHEEEDVVIPDHLCTPLLVSSHLLLITAVIAAVGTYGIM